MSGRHNHDPDYNPREPQADAPEVEWTAQDRADFRTRITPTQAKKQYGLIKEDLEGLEFTERPNPYHPDAPNMRLYLKTQVEAISAAKQEREAQQQQQAKETAAEKAAAAAAFKQAASAAVEGFRAAAGPSASAKAARQGDLALPETCVVRVLACLVSSLEPGGVRGPGLVARDIAAAAMVCRDFNRAASGAFASLTCLCDSQLLQKLPTASDIASGTTGGSSKLTLLESQLESLTALGTKLPGPKKVAKHGWASWAQWLADPLAFSGSQLKEALRVLALGMHGTKAEQVFRLLSAFGLAAPSAAPPQLLRVLQLERASVGGCVVWDGPDGGVELQGAVAGLAGEYEDVGRQAAAAGAAGGGGLAGIRAALAAAGIGDMQQLRAAVAPPTIVLC